MPAGAPRPLTAADTEWAHDLNQANGEALAFTALDPFAKLIQTAAFACAIGENDGFILAFDAPPTDESVNYRWFADRYRNFIYIDRVVVADHARRRGVARRLYAALIDYAADAGYAVVGAEVNADPPNPASDAFHAAQGFAIVGQARLADRGKTVRYFTRTV